MVLLTDRGPSGYLPEVWSSVKAAAAANPDVPTVLLLVAQDVDALASCAILMVRSSPHWHKRTSARRRATRRARVRFP